MNECLRRLATLASGGSPVLSAYVDSRIAPAAQLYGLNLHYYAARTQMPKAAKAASDEAFSVVMNYHKANPPQPDGGLALFARAGSSPMFCALPLSAPVEMAVSLRVGPAIYSLTELRDNYDRFVLVELQTNGATVSVVELGGVTRKRIYQGSGLPLLRKAARALDKLRAEDPARRWMLAASREQTDAFEAILTEDALDTLIDEVGDEEGILPRAIRRFLTFEEAEDQAVARLLPRQLTDRRLARAGWADVRSTLQQGAASRVLLSAGALESEAREEAALLAERTGARLEVVAQSRELMAAGGVACLVRPWA
ncbi:MAG: hypothetical protein K2X03_09085 [Bryobacteraceae bacterium]|nr:hypothetical protein [Bryobacteraceae bacterium]